ncbi:ABC-type nitrate/sulfonate/bicarbonate transport system substrate-binding protein [Devosia sp. UYZn731]|uniref:ABC transporter substrate-binding protein n=1 Tax=Devosia sp. UYZn731 TaxID=3156345 RepID=UPI0033913AF7
MPELDRLVVQASWINDAEFIGYFAAMAQGHYADAGIVVEHRPGYSGLVPESALLDGTAVIALSSPESVAATSTRTGAEFTIIGAQFQKSPLALISSAKAPLRAISDLVGKVIAVPPANRALVEWLARDTGVDRTRITLIDYDHDAGRLMTGEIDGFVDFAIDCTFRFTQEGYGSHTVLMYDLGARLFNNVVVVTTAFQNANRDLLRRWLNASRLGWKENAIDFSRFPAELRNGYLTSDRSLEAEVHANREFSKLMGQSHQYFTMSKSDVAANDHVLSGLGYSPKVLVWDRQSSLSRLLG